MSWMELSRLNNMTSDLFPCSWRKSVGHTALNLVNVGNDSDCYYCQVLLLHAAGRLKGKGSLFVQHLPTTRQFTCCSMGLGLDPRGLCGRNSRSAGPLVSSCSRRRDFVPGGCSQWRTVSWCSNTQLQMASDVKLRSLRGKIWQKTTRSTTPVQSLNIHSKYSKMSSAFYIKTSVLCTVCLPKRSLIFCKGKLFHLLLVRWPLPPVCWSQLQNVQHHGNLHQKNRETQGWRQKSFCPFYPIFKNVINKQTHTQDCTVCIDINHMFYPLLYISYFKQTHCYLDKTWPFLT